MKHDLKELNDMSVEEFAKYIEKVNETYKEDLKSLRALLRIKTGSAPVQVTNNAA